MRSVDQPYSAPKLGNKVNKPTPVSKEPMWVPISGQPDYMKSTDGRVKKVGCELPLSSISEVHVDLDVSYDSTRQVWTIKDWIQKV